MEIKKKSKQNESEKERVRKEKCCFSFLVVDLCQKQTNRTSAIVFRFVTCVRERERERAKLGELRERESKQALSVRE